MNSKPTPTTQKRTRLFYLGWLILGSLQLFAFSGCGQNAESADVLLSAEPKTQTERPSVSRVAPVRVSRGFFSNSLAGTITVRGQNTDSPIAWSAQPKAGLLSPVGLRHPPNIPVGDYSDQEGCASFESTGGFELCFNLMGDVDSVGLNDQEMSPTGLATYLGEPCPGTAWNIQLKAAARTPSTGLSSQVTGFSVSYELTPLDRSCDQEPLEVKISVERI